MIWKLLKYLKHDEKESWFRKPSEKSEDIMKVNSELEKFKILTREVTKNKYLLKHYLAFIFMMNEENISLLRFSCEFEPSFSNVLSEIIKISDREEDYIRSKKLKLFIKSVFETIKDKKFIENKEIRRRYLRFLIEKGYARSDQMNLISNFYDHSFNYFKSIVENPQIKTELKISALQLMKDLCEYNGKMFQFCEYVDKLLENIKVEKCIRELAKKLCE